MIDLFEDIKSYVGFTDEDTEALRSFLPAAQPHFQSISNHFYERIQAHEHAHEVFDSPEQIERLKRTLVVWMQSGLEGPHDDAYFKRRQRIGRVHVHIDLPQHYMFTAMNVIRIDFRDVVEATYREQPEVGRRVSDALDRLFDIELAIMLDTYREDSDARLRRRERLATIGQLAASVAHDLRNPLGVIESSLYLVSKRMPADERIERHVAKMRDNLDVCGKIIGNLLEMARNREARMEPALVGELLDAAVAQIVLPPGIRIEREFADDLHIAVERDLMAQALTNLLVNAAQAIDGNEGTVVVRAGRSGDGTVLEVMDDGPGFDADVIARVFEPLVTTRAKGVGLGLALVKNIAERHGGHVAAGNRDEGGAFVRVELPTPKE